MSTNIHLQFPDCISNEPVVCNLTRLFDLDFNITQAQISARREGYLILELLGSKENCQRAVDYLRQRGVVVTPVAQRIWHDEERCMQCGMCTALCPSKALSMGPDRRLVFDKERCITCALCTKVCPVNALKVQDNEDQNH